MDGQGRGQDWVGAGERTYGFWGPRWRVGKLAAGAVHGAAFVGSEGGISLWSPQAEALFGYPAEEVCGTPAVDLLTSQEDREAVLAPGDREAAGQNWVGVLLEQLPARTPCAAQCPEVLVAPLHRTL
ncbi:PAS domain-containing protein [Streptomyces sp. NPDC057696]|uniref:PAS domain-containing protein n=1 Tax=unclassified Streptomyces TaxID=2593676 RepID=UPI003680B52E